MLRHKLINAIIITCLLLCLCMAIDYADDTTITVKENMSVSPNVTETTIINGTYYSVEKDSGVAKLHKVITEKPKVPIIGMYAKPSCGCRYRYTWHYKEFVNYCPNCHHYGTLRKNPKGVPEREYTCARCSSDFCGCCGKEKYSWSRVYLRKC